MKTLIRPAVTLFILLSLITGLIYPLLVTGIGQAAVSRTGRWQPDRTRRQVNRFPADRPELSPIPKYFWGRPSATGLSPTMPQHPAAPISAR
jgi:K+-transporting ATPase ATPase C chain